ncbi:MAG: uracil-DNA glycosylase [Frankiales bacterium]|nr:uracil-DNA glycosylase [Frankiales bacterium]
MVSIDFEALDGLPAEEADDIAAHAAARWPWYGVLPEPVKELHHVRQARHRGPVYPRDGLEFAALNATAFEDVRVVLLGIDPYPDERAAIGLAFSLPAGMPFGRRAAVRNLRKAVLHDFPIDSSPVPNLNGDLSAWAGQGVLLLNRALTYSPAEGTYGHAHIWETYTDRIIRLLDERPDPPVFVLLGEPAKRISPLIRYGAMVERCHPSAPGLQREFVASGLYREIDSHVSGERIDWWQ